MYEESLALSKADRLWRDALETAASSKDIAVAEELAGYFVSIGNKDAFAAILYVCFELVRPDFVEEMVSHLSSVRMINQIIRRDNEEMRKRANDSHGDSVLVIIPNHMSSNFNVIRPRG
jgi:hypothetical protein